jgi:exonuclease SbcC
MMLKSLELENIRSYDKLKLDFPQGTILFEGPSGSGKSTVLMAIEFALFGLGSLKGGSLLRLGQKQGSVTLTFEVNGQDYTVHRTLERKSKSKSIHQGSGHIIEPSGKLSLEASELKQRILEILHFNEPEDPKAQSWIYRYAVFTPQEEMKAILSYKPDMRLQTLRKAFRLEEYKIAQDNAGKLDLEIKHKITEFETEAKGLEDKKQTLSERDAEKNEKTKKVGEFEKKETELQSDVDRLRKDLGKLQDDKIKLNALQVEIPQIQKQIDDKTFDIKTLTDASAKAKTRLAELQKQMTPLEKEKRPTAQTTEQIDKRIDDLEDQKKKLGKTESKIESKLDDYEKIEKDKKCPTCDRPAQAKDFHALVKKKQEELRKASKAVKDCEDETKRVRALLKDLQKFEANQETLNQLSERAKEYKHTLDTNGPQIAKLKEKKDELSKELEGKKKEVEGLKDVQVKIDELDKSIIEKEKSLKDTRNNLSSFRQRITDLVTEIDELNKAIKKMEDAKKAAMRLKDFHIWLNDYFVNTLALIERQVLVAINQGFNSQFQKWFNLLVEDPTKDVGIDEDFTPTVTQDGYDQDVDFLSGGEKTSAALAYRLALNSIVQQVSIGMKSNLLILDEPTDGFSKEQLYKIRDILHELQCPQVVLVSHETELESFADQIIRVDKASGESKIQTGTGP